MPARRTDGQIGQIKWNITAYSKSTTVNICDSISHKLIVKMAWILCLNITHSLLKKKRERERQPPSEYTTLKMGGLERANRKCYSLERPNANVRGFCHSGQMARGWVSVSLAHPHPPNLSSRRQWIQLHAWSSTGTRGLTVLARECCLSLLVVVSAEYWQL